MSVVYLAVLLVSLGCMVLIDRRFRLFFWHRPGVASLVLGAGLGFFIAWDLFGIALGIFARGESVFMTRWMLAPEFPVEELFFLGFLGYLTMILVTVALRLTEAVRRR
ncbi:lycopene cyclase domain-containing protein [Microbacterium sp.]|uniref:lycopene cyclase domain-containing protein n=1 Tax=Microbacterium sp. TaxID=51671 RepID=UPI003A8EE27C